MEYSREGGTVSIRANAAPAPAEALPDSCTAIRAARIVESKPIYRPNSKVIIMMTTIMLDLNIASND